MIYSGAQSKKQKLVAIVFMIVVCLFFVGFICGCGDDPQPEFSVYASDVDVVYDGREHSISVLNTLDGDVVMYSLGLSEDWDYTLPTFTIPGAYTVRFKVVRPFGDGFAEFVSSATVTIRRSILSGISSAPVVFVYDGLPHIISVDGVTATDLLEFSLDGESYSASVSVIEVGQYTVYYRVTGLYGDYASTCLLTILPNIGGRYLNASHGLITLTADRAIVGDSEFSLVYGTDKSGLIGDKAFDIADGILDFDGGAYTLLAETDHVYELTCNDDVVYFAAAQPATLGIRFDDGNAVISVGESDIAEVKDVNYCDTAHSHKNGCISVVADGYITRTALSFSKLPEQTVPDHAETFVCDGNAHSLSIDFDGELMYKVGDEYVSRCPAFADVGEHEVAVLYLRDGYLPFEATAVLYILSDIGGTYYAADGVVEISQSTAKVNGTEYTLTTDKAAWTLDGKRVELTDDGIKIGNNAYKKRTDERLLLIAASDGATVVEHSERELTYSLTSANGSVTFTIVGHSQQVIYEHTYSGDTYSVSVVGKNKLVVSAGETETGILGASDINSLSVIIFEIEQNLTE